MPALWSLPVPEVLTAVASSPDGLSGAEAARRLAAHGPNRIGRASRLGALAIVGSQLANPLLLLLVFAAAASGLSGEYVDATIVGVIVLVTVVVGATREWGAQRALAALRDRVRTRATVRRDGASAEIPLEEIVPGDVVVLSAGAIVPADGVLLEATDCHVSEAALTGESFPVEKVPGPSPEAAPIAARSGMVFQGTNVRSGTARMVVTVTGARTELGAVAGRLAIRPPETEFARGVRRFGYLLTIAMLVIVLVVFAAHVLRGRPPVETLLFAIALAVGLSPELLPAILSINLARGARDMAARGVLVRRLEAIENLGSMDVLCSDKTGTLTEGVVRLAAAVAPDGTASEAVLELAARNAGLQTGYQNPLDAAILDARPPALDGLTKLGEVPFDFVRKRLSVVYREDDAVVLVTKGAFARVLEACATVGGAPLDDAAGAALAARVDAWGAEGVRVVAVATRRVPAHAAPARWSRDDEVALDLAGVLTFVDRPKADAVAALDELARLGVRVKVITGDSRAVALHVAREVGLAGPGRDRADVRVLSGAELDELTHEALWHAAEQTDLFVEVDPRQKERIIGSLRRAGHVVGFLGDGVNDAPAMHAADTSLSVEGAVDVAREAADFVLLRPDLGVIRHGIEAGRRTFANTLKYIDTTTSANLGNMISMAVASLFLPFLPLTAGQILLNNFLSDIPAVGIADDAVDPEMVERPRRWNLRFIARFMIEFGVLSSLFDLLTFATLLFVFGATAEVFRTGWFVESLLTELVVALVVRTRRPFFRSRPGGVLLATTALLIPTALAIPYLPGAGWLGFTPLPAAITAALVGITAAYVGATELGKRWFYRHGHRRRARGPTQLPVRL